MIVLLAMVVIFLAVSTPGPQVADKEFGVEGHAGTAGLVAVFKPIVGETEPEDVSVGPGFVGTKGEGCGWGPAVKIVDDPLGPQT